MWFAKLDVVPKVMTTNNLHYIKLCTYGAPKNLQVYKTGRVMSEVYNYLEGCKVHYRPTLLYNFLK